MSDVTLDLTFALTLSPEVNRAILAGQPVVALESTVVTHGLPYPENITLAEDMESMVRGQGAVPATIAVLDGRICVGLQAEQRQRLAGGEVMAKISTRDLAPAVVHRLSGGTTVAATMLAAQLAGIQVFATGGIGGVHHDISPRHTGRMDISADLPALASLPLIVVCAGAKAILDLGATLEYLETWGVPVVGYQTDDFPAFYTVRSGGLRTSARADSPEEVVQIARNHWGLGMKSAVLVAAPPPADVALKEETVRKAIIQALREARDQKIRGQQVTPFLLRRVSTLTGGASLRANLGLLVNNAEIAARIARSISFPGQGPI
jgi:pseudouridine-5'-phosphate glycosidase